MTKTALALTAAVASVALAAPASAESRLTVRGSSAAADAVVRVNYDDLQLAQESGADTLRTRVRHAVRSGCAGLYGSATISQEWACRDIAGEAAAPQVERAITAARSGLALATGSVVVRLARR
jgi:UrcA family protein